MGTLGWGCPPQQQIFLTKFWHLVRQDTKMSMERRENNPLPRASKRSEVLPWLTPVGMSTEVFRTIDTGPKLPLFLIHQQPECAFVLLFSFPAHIHTKGKFPSSPLLPSTNSWRVFTLRVDWETKRRNRQKGLFTNQY